MAVIAASDISYSGYNDALACGLFDAIWPEPGLRPKFPGVNSLGGETPAPTYELGQILDQAQVRVSETFGSPDPSGSSNEKNDSFCRIVTKEIYHCFGDPSMQICTEMPAPFSGVSVTRGNGCVTVGNGGETARITFVNRRTGEVVSHIAPSAVYTTADFEDVDVCVSGHNRIPYIDAGKLTGIESVQTDKAAAAALFRAGLGLLQDFYSLGLLLLLVFGFWFQVEVCCQIVYGDLDRVFHIEEKIQKLHDAELEAELAAERGEDEE